MKPLFTIHAGEFLVEREIKRTFSHVNVWIPANDTGVDLLISDASNKKTVSLQVKFSRDYLATHMKDEILHKTLRACGWWTPSRQQLENSPAEYWVFVLAGFVNRSTDFIIVEPTKLLTRLDAIHDKAKKFQIYFWVTENDKCWETRGLTQIHHSHIAEGTFRDRTRDFTSYLNNWKPINALNN